MFNASLKAKMAAPEETLDAYVRLHVSFVRVHPFFDGNGRMARLLANVPVLRAGEPPIVIPREERRRYLRLLADYELATGQARRGLPLLPQPERLSGFRAFCESAWGATRQLVDAARLQQHIRDLQAIAERDDSDIDR